MTPAAELLAAEIERSGPLPFARFMETALYHPDHGYYRRPRDPFGKEGDFYTAEQIQPVFGILMAARIRQLYRAMGEPSDFTVVELGAGRREMAEAFSEWRYLPVEVDAGALPERFPRRGLLQRVLRRSAGGCRACSATARSAASVWPSSDGRFVWQEDGELSPEAAGYLRAYFPAPEEGRWYEVNLAALEWMDRIARALHAGYVFTVDYGYTRAEAVRFPAGTLMGYRRHTAREDVLQEPGMRDITAHVNFTALEEHGARPRIAHRNFSDARAGTAIRRRTGPVRRRARTGGRFAPPHAAQDAAVRYGGDVSRSVAGEAASCQRSAPLTRLRRYP